MTLRTSQQLEQSLGRLDGPCRRMDDDLWHWANWNKRGVTGWLYDLQDAPAFTQSVDAALTLLPVCGGAGGLDERADYTLSHVNGGLTIFAAVAPRFGMEQSSFGSNAAIAICRAVMASDDYHQKG